MDENNKETEKTFRKIKIPITVNISSSKNVKNMKSGDSVSTNVLVLKPHIRFPAKCVYCGIQSVTSLDVVKRKSKSKKIGSHNAFVTVLIEFLDTYSIPFCHEHFKVYKQNQMVNIIGYVLGFIIFSPLGYLISPWKLPKDLGVLVIAGVVGAIGSLLIAWVMRKILSKASERYRTLEHWPWFTIEVDDEIKNLSFRFHDKKFEKEFLKINQAVNPTL